MLTGVAQILTAAQTCNLAITDLLINTDKKPKNLGQPGLLYGVFKVIILKITCAFTVQVIDLCH